MKPYWVLFLLIYSCNNGIESNIQAPWSGLNWLDKGKGSVNFYNASAMNQTVHFSYFNLASMESFEKKMTIAPKEQSVVDLAIFRPEIIKISYNNRDLTLNLMPNLPLSLTISDTIAITGKHQLIYQVNQDFNNFIGTGSPSDYEQQEQYIQQQEQSKKIPKWFTAYLYQNNAFGQYYPIYQRAGYERFLGMTDVTVPVAVADSSQRLVEDFLNGHYQYNHDHLLAFKSNFDLMSQPNYVEDENRIYQMRHRMLQTIGEIPDTIVRWSLMAIKLENIIRKQKAFPKKTALLNEFISRLPAEYVDELNEIMKVQAKNNIADDVALQQLLAKPLLTNLEGTAPILSEDKKFKLLKFWFAGCKPCKQQIPFENDLLTQHDNLTIHHFAYATNPDIWSTYIQKNKLKGRQHLLASADYLAYEKIFDITYAPRYILLNPKNEVVCWHCANPSSKEISLYLNK